MYNMKSLLTAIDKFYNRVEAAWESGVIKKTTGLIIVLSYLLSLAAIELNIRGVLPWPLKSYIPGNRFYAIHIAFTLLLLIEVVDLVLGISHSISKAMGKQLEIFSLILLRMSFKEFTYFSGPPQWDEISRSVLPILSGAVGALFIFAALVVYYKIICHHPIIEDEEQMASFISAKKSLSLTLLGTYIVIGLFNIVEYIETGHFLNFFEIFFTILIFADILIVLISLNFSHTYPVVFRNSGFALATVTIRLALIAPHYFNIAIGAGASLFVIALTLAYNRFVLYSCEI
jgi:hypothetical protein